jgi:hypothetical protein
MAFPSSPLDKQQATINGIAYVYSTTTNSWTRLTVGIPTLSITTDTFTGDGSTSSFALSSSPVGTDYISVNIDGVGQQKTAYTLNNSTITFTGVPIIGASIEVRSWNGAALSVVTGLTYDTFTGDGTTTTFTLNATPTNKNFTLAVLSGIVQNKTTYNVTNNTISFASAPALNSVVEVTTFGPAVTTSIPSGSNTQIQFNDNSLPNGSANLTFNKTTNTLAVPNVVSTTANIVTLTVTGNTTLGNVSTTRETVSIANITTLNMLGTSNLNAISNVKITGGVTGQFIQTDGTGNLTFASGPTLGKTIAMSMLFGG